MKERAYKEWPVILPLGSTCRSFFQDGVYEDFLKLLGVQTELIRNPEHFLHKDEYYRFMNAFGEAKDIIESYRKSEGLSIPESTIALQQVAHSELEKLNEPR